MLSLQFRPNVQRRASGTAASRGWIRRISDRGTKAGKKLDAIARDERGGRAAADDEVGGRQCVVIRGAVVARSVGTVGPLDGIEIRVRSGMG